MVHDAAIENEALHYLMHATMLAGGLLFFYVIFERHRGGISIPFGLRQLMLTGTIVSNILIGSLTTMKSMVLYSAYGDERLFGLHPLADESVGGYIMWVPSSMMALTAILIVFHKWGKDEEQRYQRSQEWTGSNTAALEFPQTAEELRMKVAHVNRVTGFSLFLVSLTMLVGSLLTAILISIYG
ncbi:MAG: cytochrome c oxidase assembly protein [Paracoccaceae bacterium]|nr:cytochrome c oxidase assembly protein [Paracoccaceae bacterium]